MSSFKFIHEWGEKETPTLVKQIFVTSNFTMTLFIYRKAAFCRYLWMEDALPVTCNLSSANIRLLTLVMTTLGEGLLGGFVTFFFLRSDSNANSTEAESGGNPPLLVLRLKTSIGDKGRDM